MFDNVLFMNSLIRVMNCHSVTLILALIVIIAITSLHLELYIALNCFII